MAVVTEFRSWDELIPDALGLIFINLPLLEKMTVIPRVCKSWAKAVTGPYCWQEIDIEEWSNRCQPHQLDRLLRLLVTRSSGSLRKLSVSGLQTHSIFTFVAQNAGSLQTLRVPRSNMSDSIVEDIAGRLCMISFLDVSYCIKMGAHALEIIGKNCKLLEGLCRNMHPLDTAGKPFQDDEALAIASTMPKLKHLEMAYHLISTEGVLRILSVCPNLEFLDLRGCWGVKLDNVFLKQSFPKLKVLGPLVLGYYEREDWDDCSDFSDASEYLSWEFVAGDVGGYDDESESYDGMWDDEGRLEELELRFYEGIDDARMYWPPSP
ncbi:F-box protein FBW2 [Prosopis cineraria]|uniref:F-box protein FBW2 n=1 Tax=Prosopis cineraria TaxID=364024 RepID=UPI00240F6CA3|nr:F-box protein FBW2 [Prosopis cineraria]XP_054788253.1 F-box protein FBW2 [Prosopis cineraria]XP_054788254.1 F-box protein FBW2 [Prosopis cineraria]XP_054788255.1 F-box protein FBW2 [Prosopis cineraria]